MVGLTLPTHDDDAVTKLIARAARRLSVVAEVVPQVDESPVAPPCKAVLSPPRKDAMNSPLHVKDAMNSPVHVAEPTQCPFRRSVSKPENPTCDMAEQAISEETSQIPHQSAQKLVLLRRFSVSEQDVVICNRVRCGVDPNWFRDRTTRMNSRRYQRSLSVEEAGLAATRKRLGLTSSSPTASSARKKKHSTGTILLPFTEDEPVDEDVDPALVTANAKTTVITTTPRHHSTEPDDDGHIPRFTADLGPPPLTPREKAMHGRYLIRESLANGSYGQVCAAEEMPSHQEVAVKIIPKSILVSPEEKQSVIREQIIHKSLNHPHIIKLIDVFEDEGAHYFILERADNGSLSTLITYAGMPEDQSREVFRQLLQALEYLHRNNIIHHDIKPHNILLHKGGGDIKLCDFGASRAFNADETSLPYAGVFGTPGYIAPELLLGEKAYGPAIDMFSAGILLFEMVFGYTPFYPPSACTYQPLDFPPKAPASDDVRNLIARLLEKDPLLRITASQALGHPWITRGKTGRSAPNSPVRSPRHVLTPRTIAPATTAITTKPKQKSARTLERCLSS